MAQKRNAAINTDLIEEAKNATAIGRFSRLKERNVEYIKITDTCDLNEVYYFGDKIGQGSFGRVVSIIDKITAKDWAMKIVNKNEIGNKLIMLEREIQILKMVDHPHIIYLDKVYECSKNFYLVLERCYGVLSIVYNERKKFSESETRKLIRDLISAVAYLHKNDIVHRDLKLENILIAKNPKDDSDNLYIKITDFGLSIIKEGNGYEDMLHEYCGTLLYMAPEILINQSYSHQCDVWAVGVIMYALLSGVFPFQSHSNNEDTMSLICNRKPSFSNFTASTEAIHLITKMLDKNPALRITAAEVVHHPWIVGKPMTHAPNEPENVFDMMRLWRSEMMLPVGAECDWVSSAKAAGSTKSLSIERKSSPLVHVQQKYEQSDAAKESEHAANSHSSTPTETRRQSMHLPVKNIRFDRVTNEIRKTAGGKASAGRRTIATDLPESRRSSQTPPPSIATASKRSGHATPQSVSNNKPLAPQTSKERKKYI